MYPSHSATYYREYVARSVKVESKLSYKSHSVTPVPFRRNEPDRKDMVRSLFDLSHTVKMQFTKNRGNACNHLNWKINKKLLKNVSPVIVAFSK